MAAAVIKVRDNDDGTLDMQITFQPEIDNDSLAHRLVQGFVEYINQPAAETGTPPESAPGAQQAPD